MNEGRWVSLQVGVNAPGTPQTTTFLPAKMSAAGTSYFKSKEQRARKRRRQGRGEAGGGRREGGRGMGERREWGRGMGGGRARRRESEEEGGRD